MRLKDKVAIITGGSRGIGYATADAFLREGATVILTASSMQSAQKAVAQLKEKYPDSTVVGISPDLSDLKAVRAEFKSVTSQYGCVDILVNNAGVSESTLFTDYTEEMLNKAKQNAGDLKDKIKFRRMDAHNLEFDEGQFELIVTRNLTWNLKDPEKAYKSWYKVLRKGGKMINFDANWYLHLFDEEKRREYESDRKNVELSGMDDHYTCTDIDSMEDLARQVPLSKIQRPSWDRVVLDKIGFKNIKIDQNIWTKTWNEEEKLNYGSTPMFMIIGEK